MEEGPLQGEKLELEELNVKSNTTHDYGLDDSFDDIHDDSWVIDEEDEDEELKKIQKERQEIIKINKEISKLGELDEIDLDLVNKTKQLNKENVILKLENTKISNEIIKELTPFYEHSNEIISKNIPKEIYVKTKQKIVTEILELHNEEKLSQRGIENSITKYQKILKAKTPNEVRVIIGQLLINLSDQYKGNTLQGAMKNIGVQIMGVLIPEQLQKIDTNNEKINNNVDKINDLIKKQKHIHSTIDLFNENATKYEKLGKLYNARKQELQSKERNTKEQIQKIRELKKSNPERAKAEANELKDELLEKVEKLKQQQQKHVKPVKETYEEKQTKITNADVSNRLEHIKTLPEYGKPLETYLSGNGDVILQYSTGDYSKIYDNEFNKEIPNIKVTLNNGKVESLRKAVTIDLYSDKNVYEIKNYAQYSIKDIIPLQETKIEGTGYFKPLYLKNGKLYNIELNYTDPKTGHKYSKYILPENEEGRELNVIYRLKEGLFELKPMDLKEVHLKQTSTKTNNGTPLYLFERSDFKPCVDHYGNPSYNIQPFLRPIKI
jgi:vacuolar-type H+-ATPase subunit H